MQLLRRTTPLQRYAALVVAVVIAVVLYLFLSGAFERSEDPLAAGSAPPADAGPVDAPAPADAPRGGPVGLGGAARVGMVDYVVDEVDYPVAVPGARAVERFGRVRLRAVNRGASPLRFDADSVRIAASDGRSFAPDEELSASAAAALDGALAPPTMLQPGLASTLILIFQLPNDAGGLSLRLYGAWVDFSLLDGE